MLHRLLIIVAISLSTSTSHPGNVWSGETETEDRNTSTSTPTNTTTSESQSSSSEEDEEEREPPKNQKEDTRTFVRGLLMKVPYQSQYDLYLLCKSARPFVSKKEELKEFATLLAEYDSENYIEKHKAILAILNLEKKDWESKLQAISEILSKKGSNSDH